MKYFTSVEWYRRGEYIRTLASGRRLPRVEGNGFLAVAAQNFFNSRENQVKNPLLPAGRNLTSKTLNSLTFGPKTWIAFRYPDNRERQRIPKITIKYSFSVHRFCFNFENLFYIEICVLFVIWSLFLLFWILILFSVSIFGFRILRLFGSWRLIFGIIVLLLLVNLWRHSSLCYNNSIDFRVHLPILTGLVRLLLTEYCLMIY